MTETRKPRPVAFRGSANAARTTARVWNHRGHPLSGMGFSYSHGLVDGQHAVISVKA